MSRFLQLTLVFLVAAAATVSHSSANEAAISDDYYYDDYGLYSYDDMIEALYSDEGENNENEVLTFAIENGQIQFLFSRGASAVREQAAAAEAEEEAERTKATEATGVCKGKPTGKITLAQSFRVKS